jgi:alpha-tubulin suppressor-like RCC1 family protein
MLPILLTAALAIPPEGNAETLAFVEVVMGESHACGRRADGTVACWGTDVTAIAPGLDAGTYAKPVEVPGLDDAATIAAGDHHTCAIRSSRKVVCWGDNQAGQLGAGNTDFQSTPVSVVGLGPTLSLGLGNAHTCAVGLDGSVSCWGNNLNGQLGMPDLRTSPLPVPVSGVPSAISVAAGYGHTCAATKDGEVWCWGLNTHGALGRPTEGDLGTPAPVETDPRPIRGLASRGPRTCLLDAGGVWCWGHLTEGVAPGDFAPTSRLSREGLVALAVGVRHDCARTGGGRAVCFGDDKHGQLGGILPRKGVVVGAFGVEHATAIAAGERETCAARADGPVVCWGDYTASEREAAAKERRDVDEGRKGPVQRQLAQSTRLTLGIEEFLTKQGPRVRATVHTVEMQTCANAQLETEVTLKGKRVILELGEAFLPGGDCIATSAPAVATYDFDLETQGRRDLVVRYGKKEDYYQVFIGKGKVEIIPLQATFTEWEGPQAIRRIPPGTLAVSCVDAFWEPVCQRRSRLDLPTCQDVFARPEIADMPTVSTKDWANPYLLADRQARFLSPDFDHARYRALAEQTFVDGSGCTDLRIRTWTGETWTNRPD